MINVSRKLMFNWFRVFTILLLLGLLLPGGPAFAKTPAQDFARPVKPLLAIDVKNHKPTDHANLIPSAGGNLLLDPSFEASFLSNAYWTEFSTNTIIVCNADPNTGCGSYSTAAPRTGSNWVWFGGIDFAYPGNVSPEIGDIYQNVTFPSCGATLQFYFWIGEADAGSDANDYFVAAVDGNAVFLANATQIGSYPSYTLVSVDVSSFADGGVHQVEFYSNISNQYVTFNLDDISLVSGSNCTITGNVGASGATLSYVDGVAKTAYSQANGSYSISVPYGWSGTVTPTLVGATFTPVSRSYSNVTSAQTGQNYTAALTISGNVGVAGATLSYFDGTSKTAISDGSGSYSFTVPSNWSGTVTPSLNTDAFCPVSQTYTNLLTVRTGQNYAHDACRTFDPISKWTSAFDLSHGWTVASYVRTVGDVNNDGKDDLVGFGQDGVYVALSNGTSFDAISKWTSAFDLSHGWTVASYVRTVGDVNNDGRADLVGFGQDGVYVALSNGTSFDAISKWTSAFDLSHGWTVASYVRTVGDVNNDGRADLVGFGQDGVYVALSNGTSFGAISKWTSAFDLSHGWTVKDYVRTVGDVNNDGRADLIGFGQDGVYVALSNGTSFDAISKWTSAFDLSHGWTVKDYVRTVGDVNNDGRVDLIGFGQDGVYIALSMGTTFSLPSRRTTSFDLAHGWTVASYVRTVGDVSGDGKADLVGFGLDGVYVVK